jgi:hypothetical protein
VFPDSVRNTGMLGLPSVLVLILLVFWLLRVAVVPTRHAVRKNEQLRPRQDA